MPYDPQIHHRRSIRLKGYDYTQAGAYFVTMVTYQRESLFGDIVDGEVCLSAVGKIVWAVWSRLPAHFPLRHDEWIIMPNHIHGIIFIIGDDGRGEASADGRMGISNRNVADASPQRAPIGTTPGSLGAIIQNFKSVSTRRINQARDMPGVPVWQRDYYECIVRSEVELNQFRRYIRKNPSRWMEDDERLPTM
jgi:REP element-mobilizing transposase RayT